jgi:hypothetical protein
MGATTSTNASRQPPLEVSSPSQPHGSFLIGKFAQKRMCRGDSLTIVFFALFLFQQSYLLWSRFLCSILRVESNDVKSPSLPSAAEQIRLYEAELPTAYHEWPFDGMRVLQGTAVCSVAGWVGGLIFATLTHRSAKAVGTSVALWSLQNSALFFATRELLFRRQLDTLPDDAISYPLHYDAISGVIAGGFYGGIYGGPVGMAGMAAIQSVAAPAVHGVYKAYKYYTPKVKQWWRADKEPVEEDSEFKWWVPMQRIDSPAYIDKLKKEQAIHEAREKLRELKEQAKRRALLEKIEKEIDEEDRKRKLRLEGKL